MPRIQDIFADVGATAQLHVVDVDTGREVAVNADDQVVLASIAKILFTLEFCRQVADGQLDPAERVLVGAADRLGGWGLAGCADDVEISLRDLAYLAMSVTDNTAADLLLHRIGADTPALLAAELGLDRTRIVGGPRHVLETMFADAGARDAAEFARIYPTLTEEQVAAMRVFSPEHTTSSTAREVTTLLRLIWTDRAGSPEACAMTRDLMSRQIFNTRIASGFGDDVRLAAKTGTLPGLHMEAGVVELPDGGRYAIAVFARTTGLVARRLDVDLAIGAAARLAVTKIASSSTRDAADIA